MGLLKFWNSLTERRIKEITPQEKCKWLEQPRPLTAQKKQSPNGTETRVFGPSDQAVDIDSRPTTATDDKSSIFKRRTFSIPGGAFEKRWKKRKRLSRIPNGATEIALAVPDVPNVQTQQADAEPSLEDDIRPGTAITTDESTTKNDIFELHADSLTPVPDDEIVPEPEPQPPVKSRKRSKSSASDISRRKRSSWFPIGRRGGSDEQPPLPNSPPRPKTANTEQPFIAELPDFDSISMMPAALGSRGNSRADLALKSSPSTPNFAYDEDGKLKVSDAEGRRGSRKTFTGTIEMQKQLPTPKSFSQPLSPMLTPDNWPRPPTTTSGSSTPARRRSSHLKSAHTSAEPILSNDEARQYTRATKFMELIDHKRTSSVVSVVTEVGARDVCLDSRAQERTSVQTRWSAQQKALAALEFGIAGEAK
jgi:hypothetical protein